jgi:hypothetical protein
MQQHEQRFSDPETDEAMRLPSRKVVFVLTVVGVFMLVLAWLSSAQVTTPVPRGPATTKASAIDAAAGRLRGFDPHHVAAVTQRRLSWAAAE